MAIQEYQKPNYYNNIYKKVGVIPASTGAGALGADTNGVSIHTFTNDGIVVAVKIFSSDAGANGVFLYGKDGSTIIPEATIAITAASGSTAATANIDGLANAGITSIGDWYEMNGKRVLAFRAGQELKVSLTTALGGGESIWVTCLIMEKE